MDKLSELEPLRVQQNGEALKRSLNDCRNLENEIFTRSDVLFRSNQLALSLHCCPYPLSCEEGKFLKE